MHLRTGANQKIDREHCMQGKIDSNFIFSLFDDKIRNLWIHIVGHRAFQQEKEKILKEFLLNNNILDNLSVHYTTVFGKTQEDFLYELSHTYREKKDNKKKYTKDYNEIVQKLNTQYARETFNTLLHIDRKIQKTQKETLFYFLTNGRKKDRQKTTEKNRKEYSRFKETRDIHARIVIVFLLAMTGFWVGTQENRANGEKLGNKIEKIDLSTTTENKADSVIQNIMDILGDTANTTEQEQEFLEEAMRLNQKKYTAPEYTGEQEEYIETPEKGTETQKEQEMNGDKDDDATKKPELTEIVVSNKIMTDRNSATAQEKGNNNINAYITPSTGIINISTKENDNQRTTFNHGKGGKSVATVKQFVQDGTMLLHGPHTAPIPGSIKDSNGKKIQAHIVYNAETQDFKIQTQYKGEAIFDLYQERELGSAYEPKPQKNHTRKASTENILQETISLDPEVAIKKLATYIRTHAYYSNKNDHFEKFAKTVEARDQHMVMNCIASAELLQAYIEELGYISQIQECYSDNGDGVLCQGEAHAIVRITLPNGKILYEDATSSIPHPEQDSESISVRTQKNTLESDSYEEGRPDKLLGAKIFIEKRDNIIKELEKITDRQQQIKIMRRSMDNIASKAYLCKDDDIRTYVSLHATLWQVFGEYKNIHPFIKEQVEKHTLTLMQGNYALNENILHERIGGYHKDIRKDIAGYKVADEKSTSLKINDKKIPGTNNILGFTKHNRMLVNIENENEENIIAEVDQLGNIKAYPKSKSESSRGEFIKERYMYARIADDNGIKVRDTENKEQYYVSIKDLGILYIWKNIVKESGEIMIFGPDKKDAENMKMLVRNPEKNAIIDPNMGKILFTATVDNGEIITTEKEFIIIEGKSYKERRRIPHTIDLRNIRTIIPLGNNRACIIRVNNDEIKIWKYNMVDRREYLIGEYPIEKSEDVYPTGVHNNTVEIIIEKEKFGIRSIFFDVETGNIVEKKERSEIEGNSTIQEIIGENIQATDPYYNILSKKDKEEKSIDIMNELLSHRLETNKKIIPQLVEQLSESEQAMMFDEYLIYHIGLIRDYLPDSEGLNIETAYTGNTKKEYLDMTIPEKAKIVRDALENISEGSTKKDR